MSIHTAIHRVQAQSVSTAIDIFNVLLVVDLIGQQGSFAQLHVCQALIVPGRQQQRRFTQQSTVSSSNSSSSVSTAIDIFNLLVAADLIGKLG